MCDLHIFSVCFRSVRLGVNFVAFRWLALRCLFFLV